ncbi:MAG: TrkH family potassium uptake protein [Candidatus Cloacimonetes bacterium]|nr:TrkH family potassium uptake protein [Candidatus Cloacimonadota bacterium]
MIKFYKSIVKISSTLLNLIAIIFALDLFSHLIQTDFEIWINFSKIGLILLGFHNIVYLIRKKKRINRLISIIPDLIFITIGFTIQGSEKVFEFYLMGRQTFLLIKNMSISSKKETLFDTLSKNPPVFVLFSFLLAIFTGTLLLLLPAATVINETTTLIGALFTSTSATCVTGLIVYDTGSHFTIFGQLIILLLLQIGGLGIMTISSAFAIMVGQKLTLRSEHLIQNVVGESNKIDMFSLMENIIVITVFFELIGAILLFFSFKNDFYTFKETLYHSVFHSISAFCNAGFSLYSDNMMKFRSVFNVNFVITFLIIIGGIGFPVIDDFRRKFLLRKKRSKLSLHTKIVIVSTILLISIGFAGYFITEYNNEMKGFELKDRVFASYFQSVTTRTAGFNTIDNANLTSASAFISLILMFIGASPGSTGGGVKTTTFFIIVLSVFALLSGNSDVNIFKRKVSNEIIRKVMALIAISLTLLSFMIFLLLIIEPYSAKKIIFEAFSAFGTVGLSMGITANLSDFGKVIIVLLMYLGRVGPLTLVFAISETKIKTTYSYTEEKISIG